MRHLEYRYILEYAWNTSGTIYPVMNTGFRKKLNKFNGLFVKLREKASAPPRFARGVGYFGGPAILGLSMLLLAACSDDLLTGAPTPEYDYKTGDNPKSGSILGDRGANFLFGPGKDRAPNQSGSGIGVNVYLWRATLDTMSIWPIASADPFGGVIITDWYAPPAVPEERFKLNIYILDRALRANGVRVAVFRQTRTRSGDWRNAQVQEQTATQIENAILTRARQFRNESIQ